MGLEITGYTHIIKSCHYCPFANFDRMYGSNDCNLKSVDMKKGEKLPDDKVHDNCPLKKGDVIVKLKTDG